MPVNTILENCSDKRIPGTKFRTLESMYEDRYGADALAGDWRNRGKKVSRPVAAEIDLVVEVAGDGWCGAITRVEAGNVELEDWKGRLVRDEGSPVPSGCELMSRAFPFWCYRHRIRFCGAAPGLNG